MQRRDAGKVLHKVDDPKLGPLHALDLQPGFVPPRPVRGASAFFETMPSICIALRFSCIAAPSIAKSSL
jgi:hypothetical protein